MSLIVLVKHLTPADMVMLANEVSIIIDKYMNKLSALPAASHPFTGELQYFWREPRKITEFHDYSPDEAPYNVDIIHIPQVQKVTLARSNFIFQNPCMTDGVDHSTHLILQMHPSAIPRI